jgi:flagellar FliL protein
MKIVHSLLLGLWVLVLPVSLYAEDEEAESEEGEEAAAAPIYLPMNPQFVVNYGGRGKLRYLKAGVTLRLANADTANAVRHHMPFIRNELVMVFAAQTDETLESMDGRDAMRMTALEKVRELINREEGYEPDSVVDVLFNSLTWH